MEAPLLKGLRELRAEGLLCDASLKAASAESTPFLVHQVVLAAASGSLREYLVAAARGAGAPAVKGDFAGPPPPTQLELGGLAGATEALSAAVAVLYADGQGGAGVLKEDAAKLSAAWHLPLAADENGLAAFTPQKVCSGLRDLRAQGLLCDIVVKAGGRRFMAHQAVLAAASQPLRKFIVEKLRESPPINKEISIFGLAAEPLELDLGAISRPEAVSLALDCMYGSVPIIAPAAAQKEEAARDIRQLASSFELPALLGLVGPAPPPKAPAVETPPATSVAVPPAAVSKIVRELPASAPKMVPEMPAPAAKIAPKARGRLASKKIREVEPVAPPKQKVKAAEHEELAEEVVEEEANEEDAAVEEGNDEEAEDSPAPPPMTAEEGAAAIQSHSFGNAGLVPEQATVGGEELLVKEDKKILAKLREAFEERPLWLEAPLAMKLPAWASEDALIRLLPYLAYQWKDGPWQKGYARLGYDPRADPDEAKVLQVLHFRDPHFKPAQGKQDDDVEEDPTFRRPPSRKVQLYQLIDIHDDFITSLCDMAETLMECDRKTGWLPDFVLAAAKDRLSLKSHALRERIARRAAEVPAGRASSARTSAAGAGRGGGRGRGAKRPSSSKKDGRGAKCVRGGG